MTIEIDLGNYPSGTKHKPKPQPLDIRTRQRKHRAIWLAKRLRDRCRRECERRKR